MDRVLRPVSSLELDALWALRTRAVRAGCAGHYPAAVIDAWVAAPVAPSLVRLAQAGGALVLEEEGVVLGFAALDAHSGEIDAVFVEPARQGRGLALVLINALEDMARQAGLRRLYLSAALNAVPFYRRAGYTALRDELYPHHSGIDIASVFMEKSL